MNLVTPKGKLPKNYSYALKASLFEQVLHENNIEIDLSLSFNHSKIFFDARYIVRSANCEYDRIHVRTGSVLSKDRLRAQNFIQKSVVLDFIEWAKNLISQPRNSTQLTDNKYVYYHREFT